MAIKVFIDTNIYENANFSFDNKQFSKLRELIEEGCVELLYNEIIYQEVLQHIGDNLIKAVSQYNQVIAENRAFAPFRWESKWSDKIAQIDENEMINDLRMRWDEYINSTGAVNIPISDVDINEIINKYFKKLYPFENKKPNEFKDAICIDSIMKYYESIEDEKIYVIAADKGFRKSFRGQDEYIVFFDLNTFLNYAISQNEHLSTEIENAFESGILNESIFKSIDNQLYMGNVDVEDVFDEIDLLSVETQSIEFGYIHELDEESAVVVANATVNVEVEYTVRDEDNSYYDREDDRYYWENFLTYRSMFCVDVEIEVAISIEKNEKDLSIDIEIDEVDINTSMYLHESDIVESEVIHNTMDDESDEERYDENASYCPDCGCKMDYANDMGAFCIKCSPNH